MLGDTLGDKIKGFVADDIFALIGP